MTKSEFERASLQVGDQAWSAAMLFELLQVAYSALARGRMDEWNNALLKLSERPVDDEVLVQARRMHENLCDLGLSSEFSQVTSDIFYALAARLEA